MIKATISRSWRFLAVAAVATVLAAPAHAVTCSEVRAMSAADISYWAKRLQVPPQKLAALLAMSFCEPRSEPTRSIAANDKTKTR
jgi:hypothetical protein